MATTHIHLPPLEILKKWLEEKPEKIKFYQNNDTWIGPTESVEYLKKLIESLNK